MICIKNGTVYNAVTPEGVVADILVENGKIKEIGPNLSVGANVEVIDAIYSIFSVFQSFCLILRLF